jgi:23S rRNA (cytosine1962-C5)-methyltransferase
MFDPAGVVRLSEGEDRRIRDGHVWIYRNEIADPPGDLGAGDLVWVEDARGRKLGLGAFNPDSLISVRLLERGAGAAFTAEDVRGRLAGAAASRRHMRCDAKRLVNAEGDSLPGLVVDLYGKAVVAQFQSAFWEKRADLVIGEIASIAEPDVIVLRNDSAGRKAEGLDAYTRVVKGELAANVMIREAGLTLEVDVLSGHKTGFYIDQRANRTLPLDWVESRRVLDCFCYTGAWSLMCARAGASEVRAMDCSAAAVALARRNAEANGLGDVAGFTEADVFDELPSLASAREKFGVILLDPPSLARSRKTLAGAERGYIHLNRVAMGLLEPGGILATCSCSHHMTHDRFRAVLLKAASLARKRVTVLKTGGQPEDHPSLLGVPETEYLKCFVLRVA